MPTKIDQHKYTAKSLIELLLYCMLVISISTIGFYNYINKTNDYKNFLKLKKLQQTIYLARSEAINNYAKVKLCPSHNMHTCSQDWTKYLIIFIDKSEQGSNNQQILHQIQLQFSDPLLRFNFFGNQQNQIITFLPNGLTNNNGHFCINDSKQHCLYLNKAGKIYILNRT